jgi:hypothetical protein
MRRCCGAMVESDEDPDPSWGWRDSRNETLWNFLPIGSRYSRSLGFDIQFLRQPPVFFVYEAGELRAAAADRLLVGFEKMLPNGRVPERLSDLAAEAVNNRGRRAGRNEREC